MYPPHSSLPDSDPHFELIQQLSESGVADSRVLRALSRVQRELFLLPQYRDAAYDDESYPIGHCRRTPSPHSIAARVTAMELTGVERVLEIGTGDGYQSAVLAELAADVYSVEVNPSLACTSARRLHRAGYHNVRVVGGSDNAGLPRWSPYDAIVVNQPLRRVPPELVDQLAPFGRLVVPIRVRSSKTLFRIRKNPGGPSVEVVERMHRAG